MISDLDLYRSANVLIRQHSDNAALEAAMRARVPPGIRTFWCEACLLSAYRWVADLLSVAAKGLGLTQAV